LCMAEQKLGRLFLDRARGTPSGTASVPCNGCTACCRSGQVLLKAGDDPAMYETVSVADPFKGERLALKTREDGSCVYLAEHGCSIHERRPLLCMEFDCRLVAAAMPEGADLSVFPLTPQAVAVITAGRKRLKSL
jgi:hypothetical protein